MLSLLLLFSVVILRIVSGQIVQTNATCTSEFGWMGNSKGSSPCLVVAELDAVCNYGTWTVIPLNGTNAYVPPVGQWASLCTCSWASYNLISACAVCQGYPEKTSAWGAHIAGCSGKTTDNTYWPPSISLSSDVKIPYWASTDPKTWTNQKFNSGEARTIYQAGYPDLPSETSQESSSKPTGAIVGGVIGGLAVLVIFIGLSVCIVRRHRRTMQNAAHPEDRLAHMRKISDSTVTSGNVTLADSLSLRPIVPTPSTNVQRSTSISSLPFFSSLIGRESRMAMGQTPTPQDPGVPPLEEVINPYTLPPVNDIPEKKTTDGEWPVFDQPTAPPPNTVRMAVLPSQSTPRKTSNSRYNPPAYSESDTTTPLSPTMSRHQNQDSIDSTLSTPMATEASDSTMRRGVHTPANSGSSIAHMGISNPIRGSTSTFHTLQTSISTRRTSAGQVSTMGRGGFGRLFSPGSQEAMNHAEERTEASFSPSEIA